MFERKLNLSEYRRNIFFNSWASSMFVYFIIFEIKNIGGPLHLVWKILLPLLFLISVFCLSIDWVDAKKELKIRLSH